MQNGWQGSVLSCAFRNVFATFVSLDGVSKALTLVAPSVKGCAPDSETSLMSGSSAVPPAPGVDMSVWLQCRVIFANNQK
jgi:hypothetical protein